MNQEIFLVTVIFICVFFLREQWFKKEFNKKHKSHMRDICFMTEFVAHHARCIKNSHPDFLEYMENQENGDFLTHECCKIAVKAKKHAKALSRRER